MALHDYDTDTDAALRSALLRVSEADQRLLETADAAGQRAKSRLNEAAVAIALGAAIALLVGGATGRRRLASSLLGMAVPVVGTMVAQLFAKQKRLEERQDAVMRWEGEGGEAATTGMPTGPSSAPARLTPTQAKRRPRSARPFYFSSSRYCVFGWIWIELRTLCTPFTLRARLAARVLSSALVAKPDSWTTPFIVSTEMRLALTVLSSANFALTFEVMVASST